MWETIFKKEQNKDYYKVLLKRIKKERLTNNVYPKEEDVFKAFELTPFNKVKVIIIGQDPYHQPNQAHGLAFSSLAKSTPKSLANIKKELKADLNIKVSKSNDLTGWAREGILLINTILTVNDSKPLSHQGYGWEKFTLSIIKELCSEDRPLVFILWGNNAKSYIKYITNKKHLIIASSHPSPLSAYISFFGSKPFSKTNQYLKDNNLKPINFKI